MRNILSCAYFLLVYLIRSSARSVKHRTECV
jgi:hypothetical protein